MGGALETKFNISPSAIIGVGVSFNTTEVNVADHAVIISSTLNLGPETSEPNKIIIGANTEIIKSDIFSDEVGQNVKILNSVAISSRIGNDTVIRNSNVSATISNDGITIINSKLRIRYAWHTIGSRVTFVNVSISKLYNVVIENNVTLKNMVDTEINYSHQGYGGMFASNFKSGKTVFMNGITIDLNNEIVCKSGKNTFEPFDGKYLEVKSTQDLIKNCK